MRRGEEAPLVRREVRGRNVHSIGLDGAERGRRRETRPPSLRAGELRIRDRSPVEPRAVAGDEHLGEARAESPIGLGDEAAAFRTKHQPAAEDLQQLDARHEPDREADGVAGDLHVAARDGSEIPVQGGEDDRLHLVAAAARFLDRVRGVEAHAPALQGPAPRRVTAHLGRDLDHRRPRSSASVATASPRGPDPRITIRCAASAW